jgi:transcription elongation factor Elf1
MDLENPPEIAGIAITCPHCGRVETDDFEVLNLDEVHAITCDGCKQRFHLDLADHSHASTDQASIVRAMRQPAD